MKKIFLVCLMMLFCGIAWADVDATILKVDQDNNGAIRVYTQYSVDGSEINPCNYPDLIDGKHYCVFRMSIQNVGGGDPVKIMDFVDTQIKTFSEHLIKQPVEDQLRADALTAQTVLADSTKIKGLVGRKVIIVEATILKDSNFDGKPDKKLTVDTKGVKSEEDYIPIDLVVSP